MPKSDSIVLLQETTEWKDGTPNHVYVFINSTTKIAGYIKAGEKVAFKFSNPLVFSKRFRKFKRVNKKDYDLSTLLT